MKSPTNPLIALAYVAGLATYSPLACASLDDTGFYVGANVGRVLSTYRRTAIDENLLTALASPVVSTQISDSAVQKSHAMWTVDVGYMLSRNFGIEASYINLGALRYSAFGNESGGATKSVAIQFDLKSKGPALAVVGALPMSNLWEVDARVGAYAGKARSNYSSTFGEDTTPGSSSKSSTSMLLGVGTGLTLTSHCTARLDYLRIQKVKENVLDGSFNVDLVTMGFAFVF